MKSQLEDIDDSDDDVGDDFVYVSATIGYSNRIDVDATNGCRYREEP